MTEQKTEISSQVGMQSQRSQEESSFTLAQRMATALSSSDMIPQHYRGKDKIGNILVAMEMAKRMNIAVPVVMQNLYVIKGNPSWSSSFIISCINACKKFSPLRFEIKGEGAEMSCRAWAYDLRDEEKLFGSTITMKMAKAEGWSTKVGSKWITMPEQMLCYRAAAFFGRLYAPELLNGLMTSDECEDVYGNNKEDRMEHRKEMTEKLIGKKPVDYSSTANVPYVPLKENTFSCVVEDPIHTDDNGIIEPIIVENLDEESRIQLEMIKKEILNSQTTPT